MKNKLKFILLLIFFFLTCFDCGPSKIEAAIDPTAPIRVSVSSFVADTRDRAYSVFIVKLSNKTNRKLNITILLRDESYKTSYLVEKQVVLMPASSGEMNREERMIVPGTCNSPKFTFKVEGKTYEDNRVENMISLKISGSYSYDGKYFLVDKNITNSDNLFKDPGVQRNKPTTFVFSGSQEEMEKDWLAYSQFDALIFLSDTFETSPELVQNAILDYVRLGGNLFLIGEIKNESLIEKIGGKQIASEKSSIKSLFSIFKPEPRKNDSSKVVDTVKSHGYIKGIEFGLGSISCFEKSLFDLMMKSPPEEEKSGYYGYSSYSRSSTKSETKTTKEEEEKKYAELNKGKIFNPKEVIAKFDEFSHTYNNRNYKDCFTVERDYKYDYKIMKSPLAIMFFVLLFALLLGPINLFVLNKYKARIMVFVSVPVISIICCTMVFVYFLLFEYNRLELFRQSFTLLDNNSGVAITFGSELIVSGKTLNNELAFPLSSVIYAYDLTYRNVYGVTKEIRLDKDQNFTYEWIKPKVPLAYYVKSKETAKFRLEVKESENEIEFINGLGSDIDEIYILSEDGKNLCKAFGIGAGKNGRASVYIDNFSYNPSSKLLIKNNFRGLLKKEKPLDKYAKDCLKPGEYIAKLRTNPFMRQNFDSRASIKELGCYVHGTSKKGGSL